MQRYLKWHKNGRNTSLESAAARIGMSKKSLDDYILIIRQACKLGYDFDKNKDSMIGHLRTFVKEHKN